MTSIYPHAYVQAYEEMCRGTPDLAQMAACIDAKVGAFRLILRNLREGTWPPGRDTETTTGYESDTLDSSFEGDNADEDVEDDDGDMIMYGTRKKR